MMNCSDASCMFVVTDAAVVVESSCRQPWMIIAIIFIVMFVISVAANAIIFAYYWRYV